MDAGGTVYYMLKKDGSPISGIMEIDEASTGTQPHWMLYFQVNDVDAATATVKANGGTVSREPFATPFGRVAVTGDPSNAPFSMIQMSRPS